MPLPCPIEKLLSSIEFIEDQNDYVIVSMNEIDEDSIRLLKSLGPFTSITFDRDEISIVLKSDHLTALKDRFPRHRRARPYRLITLQNILDLSTVGFLSRISASLADEGISIFVISTYLRDHILVRKRDVRRATAALSRLKAQAEQAAESEPSTA